MRKEKILRADAAGRPHVTAILESGDLHEVVPALIEAIENVWGYCDRRNGILSE